MGFTVKCINRRIIIFKVAWAAKEVTLDTSQILSISLIDIP